MEIVKVDLDINDIQGNMTEVSIPAKMELEDIQVPSEKTKENSMVGFKKEGVLISNVKFQGRSYAMLGESIWRPKTRPKNKLRLNMKQILNQKLAKEKITMIDSEDSSSQENLKEDEDQYEQEENTREDLVIQKPSLMKNTVKEQFKDFSFKGDNSKQVPVTVKKQHKEDHEDVGIY